MLNIFKIVKQKVLRLRNYFFYLSSLCCPFDIFCNILFNFLQNKPIALTEST